jgi:hypothetical protein
VSNHNSDTTLCLLTISLDNSLPILLFNNILSDCHKSDEIYYLLNAFRLDKKIYLNIYKNCIFSLFYIDVSSCIEANKIASKLINCWCMLTIHLTTISTELGFLWDFVLLKFKTCSLYHENLFIQKFKFIRSQVLNNFFSTSDNMEAVRGRFSFYGMNGI